MSATLPAVPTPEHPMRSPVTMLQIDVVGRAGMLGGIHRVAGRRPPAA